MDGVLSLPRLGPAQVDVTFLVDTGATFTVIHPKDLKAMGLDVMRAFASQPTDHGRGIGGVARYFKDEARLSFEHATGEVVDYLLPVNIAVPTDVNADYPSMLGMDFLYAFRLVVSMPERTLTLDYISQ